MGPEDDLKREIRALLSERGAMSTAMIAEKLQCDPGETAKAILDMRDAEYLGGFDRDAQRQILRVGQEGGGFR